MNAAKGLVRVFLADLASRKEFIDRILNPRTATIEEFLFFFECDNF